MSPATLQRGWSLTAWLASIALACLVLAGAYLWLVLHFSYSEGERAGWVQKLSHKGWICKTWEGELAMVSMPGTAPEKFLFTVRDEAIATELNSSLGKRVAVAYEEHPSLVSSCFGETRYFVTRVHGLDDAPTAATPAAAGTPPAAGAPSAAPHR